jgi:hypothetical protein
MFDAQVWGLDRNTLFAERQSQVVAAVAAASSGKRLQQRLDLACFYIAREMYPEAKGVLDVSLAEDQATAEDVTGSALRAITEVLMNRPDAALKDLSNPSIGDQHDAPLWRAMAFAGQGKWAMARDNIKSVEASVAALPVELERVALKTEMRAAIELYYGERLARGARHGNDGASESTVNSAINWTIRSFSPPAVVP